MNANRRCLHVTTRTRYGKDHIFPVNAAASDFVSMIRRKGERTIPKKLLLKAVDLGYEVIVDDEAQDGARMRLRAALAQKRRAQSRVDSDESPSL